MPTSPYRIATRHLWLPALAGALLVHVAAFGLLRVKPARPGHAAAPSPAPACSVIQPAPVGAAWERQLLAWAELADPSILSLPDPRHGFSRLLVAAANWPLTDLPAFETSPAATAASSFAPIALTAADPDLAASLRHHWTCLVPTETETPSPAVPGRTVVWRLADGTPLTGIAEIAEADLKQARGTTLPQQPSRFHVLADPLAAGLRLRLAESCGVDALDRIAYQRLARRLLDWERDLRQKQAVLELEPLLRAPDLPVLVEVEWRLALEPPPPS